MRIDILDYGSLANWQADDHAAAFRTFRRGTAVLAARPPKTRGLGVDAERLSAILARASRLPADISRDEARTFFETEFVPVEIRPESAPGFFTGYYEPILAGSRIKTGKFAAPLYRRPDDLVEFDPQSPPPGIDADFRFARKTTDGYKPYYDRSEIESGALDGRELELVFLDDPVDAFFVHVQGAARIDLDDGSTMRVTYAAKSGHPYTSIGRVLIEMGALAGGKATMAAIRDWLAAHPEQAKDVMTRNRSFIFFREAPAEDPRLGPVAAAKVPLTAGRSLAVDRLLHTFHAPVWVETTLPGGAPFRQLLIAQDTGSAIVGPARGDIFLGSGDEAGAIAGAMAANGRFILLAPRGSALAQGDAA